MFGDVGSGCGRLVVAQALTWPWRACRGVEIVPSLHDIGEASLEAAGRIAGGGEDMLSPAALGLLESMAPCSLSLGDVNDEVSYAGRQQHGRDEQDRCSLFRYCYLSYCLVRRQSS